MCVTSAPLRAFVQDQWDSVSRDVVAVISKARQARKKLHVAARRSIVSVSCWGSTHTFLFALVGRVEDGVVSSNKFEEERMEEVEKEIP